MTNPEKIRWREWGEEAFQEARELDRPILLSISATWCHVMDRTSYADEEVAELINSAFIPIRVDNDRRPDINARYNMGGWPTTAILTPGGDILTGGTYIPPEQLKQVLRQISQYYHLNKAHVYATILERKRRANLARQGAPQGQLSEAIVHEGVNPDPEGDPPLLACRETRDGDDR
ncbi:MAG: DUF255 domain-containing protein [Anaerolineae bacterium]